MYRAGVLYILGEEKQICRLPSDLENGRRGEWSWFLCMMFMNLLISAPLFYMFGIIVVEILIDSELRSKDASFY